MAAPIGILLRLPDQGPMLEIQNLSKFYGQRAAVQNLNLTIKRGEIFSLLGLNGAGKTTTFKILAGLALPSAGSAQIFGHDIRRDSCAAKAVIGYIPDRPFLYPKLSAREFLTLVGELYMVPPPVAGIRIDELLDEYQLSDRQHELTESYSHGMRQRLATIAALLHDPLLLILDEPMVGLDPLGARILKAALRRYAEAGKIVLLSTHSLDVAEKLSDRMAIMSHGKIVVEGTVPQIQGQDATMGLSLEEIFIKVTSDQGKQ